MFVVICNNVLKSNRIGRFNYGSKQKNYSLRNINKSLERVQRRKYVIVIEPN